MVPSSITTMMVGINTGMITRKSVPSVPEPDVRAASSSDASMFLNAGVSRITLMTSVFSTRWANTMPHHDLMLKGESSTKGSFSMSWLRRPLWPSSRKIQPIRTGSVGRKNAIQKPNSSQLRPGTLVRASSHASSTPMTKAMPWRVPVSVIVLMMALRRIGSSNAALQLSSPKVVSPPKLPT